MSDWTSGYVADIGYTFGYYGELNPLRTQLALLSCGLVCPEVGTACELGFGQGLSTNLHAAASGTRWYGTDFNPAQAGFAQELATAGGTGAKMYDEAFEDFTRRDDLPDFDYIGLHGIWSWISDENRKAIVEFVRRKLKVGGVLYISYNTLPGWAAFAPMRHLMTEHSDIIGAEGRGILSRIDDAIDFAEKLLATKPMFARANPLVEERIKKLKQQNRHYLAHEYFNRDWHPMHFSTIADWLEPAKLQYACSAFYLDFLDGIHLTPEQQTFLKQIPDVMFRQSVRDFIVNQQFRRDFWVKGARRLSRVEQLEQLRSQRVVLGAPRAGISMKVTGTLGEGGLNEQIYGPVLDLLADFKIRSLAQIEKEAGNNITINQLVEVVMALIGAGHLHSAQSDAAIASAKPRTDVINKHLILRARGTSEVSYLASPVTGGGIAVGRFYQLFLLAMTQGKSKPADLAKSAWQVIAPQAEKIIKEGKTLETPEQNIAELTQQADSFRKDYLPILQALQIA